MQKWTAKMKSTQKTGYGAPRLKKVNSRKKSTINPTKSQRSNLLKVNISYDATRANVVE